MLAKNLITLVTLVLSVSALPHNAPTTNTGDKVSVPDHHNLIANGCALASSNPLTTPPTDALDRRSPSAEPDTTISGQDGEGNQVVGNSGQNAGNAAVNEGHIGGDYTVKQATKTCGNAQLNCCNKVSKKGDTTNAGLLGSVFGSGDLGVQCSPVNVPVLAIEVPINKACDAKAACCQGDTTQNGLVNVGCVSLASLV